MVDCSSQMNSIPTSLWYTSCAKCVLVIGLTDHRPRRGMLRTQGPAVSPSYWVPMSSIGPWVLLLIIKLKSSLHLLCCLSICICHFKAFTIFFKLKMSDFNTFMRDCFVFHLVFGAFSRILIFVFIFKKDFTSSPLHGSISTVPK